MRDGEGHDSKGKPIIVIVDDDDAVREATVFLVPAAQRDFNSGYDRTLERTCPNVRIVPQAAIAPQLLHAAGDQSVDRRC